MNITVPPSNCALHDNFWPGLKTIVVKQKSVRQARGGVSLDMRIFSCQISEKEPVARRWATDPFEVTMCEAGIMEVFQTLGRPVQLLSRFSEGCDREVK